MPRKKKLSRSKARQMLHDDSAQGHKLTKKQRGFFGAVAKGKARKRNKKKKGS